MVESTLAGILFSVESTAVESKTRNVISQIHQSHPNEQGLTSRSGRRVVLGGGQGSLAATTAAGGRPPAPTTAYQPRQTRPENLPWHRTSHLIEIKYVKTLALSSSSKLPMLSTVALETALQETMFFMFMFYVNMKGCYLHSSHFGSSEESRPCKE